METVSNAYDESEDAWVSDEISLRRDIYLIVSLSTPGKLLIRQQTNGGDWLRVPLKRHKDSNQFALRISVHPDIVKIKIFTSTQPKEIRYAYI